MRQRAEKGLQPSPQETGKEIPGGKRGEERRVPREGGRWGSRQESSQTTGGGQRHAHPRVVYEPLSTASSA